MLDLTDATSAFRERFWSKVDRRGPDDCWLWTAAVDKRGYGKFSIARSQWTAASRVAYALSNGIIPDGTFICHSCDNPGCCNPAHLWIGDSKSNHDDMLDKGRQHCPRNDGEHNPRAIFTADDVLSIRQRIAQGETRMAISREYGVSWGTVDHAVRKITWRHL
jgi:hypothetical protein